MNAYREVIDIITKDQDWRDIVLTLAKEYPEILIKVVKKPFWLQGARRLLLAEQYISAIKYHREQCSSGLKEAKEAIDQLYSEMDLDFRKHSQII